MRYDPSKSFPYPVLRERSEDYVDGAFQVTPTYSISSKTDKVKLEVQFSIGEDAIGRLIKRKKAKYALLVESRDTYFRDLIITSHGRASRSYDGGKIRGVVVLSPYVVAAQDISGFSSKNFNSEYSGKSFSIRRGDVLALESPREFYVGQEVFAHIGTVFELVEGKELRAGQLQLNLEEEKIQIRVTVEQKTLIDNARKQSEKQSVLVAGIYLPVLMEVLHNMSKDSTAFESKKWYRSVKAKCEMAGLEISDGMDLLSVAQSLLEYPLHDLSKSNFGGRRV